MSSARKDENTAKNVYQILRCIQFYSSFLQKFGIPGRVNPKKSSRSNSLKPELQEPEKPFTRSQGKVDEQSVSSKTSLVVNPSNDANLDKDEISPTWCLLEVLLSKCIQHDSHRVRVMCIKFLEVIKESPNLSYDWKDLISRILHYKNEIVADSG